MSTEKGKSMKKYKVLVTRFFLGDAIELLNDTCEITKCEQIGLLPKERLMELSADKDILFISEDTIDREILDNAPDLKVIADIWGRGRNVDKESCRKKGIEVYTSPITLKWINHSETEHALLLLLAVTRRLLEADAYVRAGKFTEPEQANRDMLGTGLHGKHLGIIGGTHWSGDEMVKRAVPFGMKVTYWDQERSREMEELGADWQEFDELLETSDFIILMANGCQGYLLDKPQFDKMKKGAFLVNVTRGSLIHERELVNALKDGRLAGAGLDKYENEPSTDPELVKLKNVVLTPHSDGALLEERNRIYLSVVKQVLEWEERNA